MTNCRRGDVILVLFPNSDLRTSKRRPALVVQSDEADSDLPQTIVAMISSNMSRAGRRSRLVVPASRENGLMTDSVVMTDNLATIRYSEIDRIVGQFTAITDLDIALRVTLAL